MAGLLRTGRNLNRMGKETVVLVQYVPHAYGAKAMNVAFPLWLLWRKWRYGNDIRIMFHEVAYPWVRWPLHHNLIAAVNRFMAAVLVQASSRIYLSIPGWLPLLPFLGSKHVEVLGIPSTIPQILANDESQSLKRQILSLNDKSRFVVAHFGTYGSLITELLGPAIRTLLDSRSDVLVLLLGGNSERFRSAFISENPQWSDRIIATGRLSNVDLATHLIASDVALQPFPDGASGRRTSIMASLINGVPVVTNTGHLSEEFWIDSGVAVVRGECSPQSLAKRCSLLLDDSPLREKVGIAGQMLYDKRFSIENTMKVLLADFYSDNSIA